MTKTFTSLQPRCLTHHEVLEVCAEQWIASGLFFRAATFAQSDGCDLLEMTGIENVRESIYIDAEQNVKDWLADMASDNQPRHYNSTALKQVLREFFDTFDHWFLDLEPANIPAACCMISARDFGNEVMPASVYVLFHIEDELDLTCGTSTGVAAPLNSPPTTSAQPAGAD